jgi:hypothetical protein
MKSLQFLKILTLWDLNTAEIMSYIVKLTVLTMQNYGGSQQIEETLCGAWHLHELMDENGFAG